MKEWKKRIKIQDGEGVETGEAGQCTTRSFTAGAETHEA